MLVESQPRIQRDGVDEQRVVADAPGTDGRTVALEVLPVEGELHGVVVEQRHQLWAEVLSLESSRVAFVRYFVVAHAALEIVGDVEVVEQGNLVFVHEGMVRGVFLRHGLHPLEVLVRHPLVVYHFAVAHIDIAHPLALDPLPLFRHLVANLQHPGEPVGYHRAVGLCRLHLQRGDSEMARCRQRVVPLALFGPVSACAAVVAAGVHAHQVQLAFADAPGGDMAAVVGRAPAQERRLRVGADIQHL